AEAGRARGQAVCACARPDQDIDSCVAGEDISPNAACLHALLPDDSARWDCRATQLWSAAKCLDAAGCSPEAIAKCPSADLPGCPNAASSHAESYCERRLCALDLEKNLQKSQICDG